MKGGKKGRAKEERKEEKERKEERKKKKGRNLQTSGLFIAFLGKLGQRVNKSFIFAFVIYFKLLKYILNYF